MMVSKFDFVRFYGGFFFQFHLKIYAYVYVFHQQLQAIAEEEPGRPRISRLSIFSKINDFPFVSTTCSPLCAQGRSYSGKCRFRTFIIFMILQIEKPVSAVFMGLTHQ